MIEAYLIILAFVIGVAAGIAVMTYCIRFSIKASREVKTGTTKLFVEPDSVDDELKMLEEQDKKELST
jgi:hypothetical protein